MPHSPEDRESWETSVTDLSVAVKLPVAECGEGKGAGGYLPTPLPHYMVHGWAIEKNRGFGWIKMKKN